MGIVPIIEMYGVAIAVMVIVAVAAAVAGVFLLVRKIFRAVKG